MKDRCGEMESRTQCESEKGAQKRCRWDYGVDILKLVEAHASTGCVWDGTGCFGDCDQNQMKDRCAEMESQSQCESQSGAQKRCRWDYGVSSNVFSAFVVGRGIGMEMDISTMNMLLFVAAVITVLFAVRQLIRWYGNKDYHKLNEVEMTHELGVNLKNTV